MGDYAHVQEIRGLGSELARQYLWEALVTPQGGGPASPEQMQLRAMSTMLPDNASEETLINYKSTKIQFAGRDASTKSLDLTFFDTEDLLVYKTFYNWVTYTKEAPKSAYESDLTLRLLSRADAVILEMVMFGAYPENLQQVTLDYSAGDPLNIPVTMRYDYIVVR